MALHFNPVIFFYSFRIEHRTYTAGTMTFLNDSSFHFGIRSGHRTGVMEALSCNEYIALVPLRLL